MKDFDILSGFLFFFALSGSIYFGCSFIVWIATKLKPDNFKKEITKKDIMWYNYVMIISILCWSVLYCVHQ